MFLDIISLINIYLDKIVRISFKPLNISDITGRIQ